MSRRLRIIFMGTPAFAVPALSALVRSGHDVALVCTQPDRPSGRGRKIRLSPVKQYAIDLNLPLFQPVRLREAGTTDRLAAVNADVMVVVAYGRILPPAVLATAPFGAVNIHASLLPLLRGPAPIQWAIIHQLPRTGVTIMQMDAGLDTGAILLQESTPISPAETAATLHDRLAEMGAAVLPDTLTAWVSGQLTPAPQNHDNATYAPMLTKHDGRIAWHRPAVAIEASIRGMTPWPGAFTMMGDQRLKIFKAQSESETATVEPGTVVSEFPGELRVATGEGILAIAEVQGASGKRMPIDAFLRGTPIAPGTRFS